MKKPSSEKLNKKKRDKKDKKVHQHHGMSTLEKKRSKALEIRKEVYMVSFLVLQNIRENIFHCKRYLFLYDHANCCVQWKLFYDQLVLRIFFNPKAEALLYFVFYFIVMSVFKRGFY